MLRKAAFRETIEIITADGIAATAKIVTALPEIGAEFAGDRVKNVIPTLLREQPPAGCFTVWEIKRERKLRVCFVAMREKEAV